MRARPIDPAALCAATELVVVAARERLEPVLDVGLGNRGEGATAAQAAGERRQLRGQVQPLDHLHDLIERAVGPDVHTVGDVAALEQSAVAVSRMR